MGILCKTVAISKYPITYARYAVRDDDARKPLAINERSNVYFYLTRKTALKNRKPFFI